MDEIIINFCPTGVLPRKENTSYVPIWPTEIIEQTHEAYQIGITIIHLFAKDVFGLPSYYKSICLEIFEGGKKVQSGFNYRHWQRSQKEQSDLHRIYLSICRICVAGVSFSSFDCLSCNLSISSKSDTII